MLRMYTKTGPKNWDSYEPISRYILGQGTKIWEYTSVRKNTDSYEPFSGTF